MPKTMRFSVTLRRLPYLLGAAGFMFPLLDTVRFTFHTIAHAQRRSDASLPTPEEHTPSAPNPNRRAAATRLNSGGVWDIDGAATDVNVATSFTRIPDRQDDVLIVTGRAPLAG
jgi:hypothetical protein